MKRIKFKLIIICLLLISNFAFAQWEEDNLDVSFNLPSIALVDIEPDFNNTINFSIIPSNESGAEPEIIESSNQSLWLNYSSALEKMGHTRSITAEISDGKLPDGIILYLQASNYQGIGKGDFGKTTGKIELTTQPRSIISNVGNCFTGDGVNNGHLLSFSIIISDFTKLNSSDETSLTILYTISDN